jgi:hypothetical protein
MIDKGEASTICRLEISALQNFMVQNQACHQITLLLDIFKISNVGILERILLPLFFFFLTLLSATKHSITVCIRHQSVLRLIFHV